MPETIRFSEKNFRKQLPKLCDCLGRPARALTPEEEALLKELVEISRLPGQIGPADTYFLYAMLRTLGGERLLEIGVASGFSTVVLLHALRNSSSSGFHIDSVDRRHTCLFDDNRPIGFRVQELAPELASRVTFHLDSDSYAVGPQLAPRSLDAAFIDGNHQHPWPLEDILNILPALKPGSWILMHDINLPQIAGQLRAQGQDAEPRHGAAYAFEHWTGPCINGGNVGAMRLPERKEEFEAWVMQLLDLPFETGEQGNADRRKRIMRTFQKQIGLYSVS